MHKVNTDGLIDLDMHGQPTLQLLGALNSSDLGGIHLPIPTVLIFGKFLNVRAYFWNITIRVNPTSHS